MREENGWSALWGATWLRRRVLRGLVINAVVLVSLAAVDSSAAAAAGFSATGSADQVYVTGAPAGASMSLLTSSGTALYTQSADAQGGLLFRNVPAGKGYRVQLNPSGPKSGPITVHSDAAAPWDPGIYSQSIPDNGYTYLTTRDGTKLAIDVHPPSSPAGEPGAPSFINIPPLAGLPGVPSVNYAPAVSDADRVLGLRLRRPGGTSERDRGARQPDGLRGGRRQHAWDRLLGRGV